MMYSMTGFGVSEAQENGKSITVEIRALNSRNLDLSLKVPSSIRESELLIRQMLTEKVQRGKVALSVKIDGEETGSALNINKKAFTDIVKQVGDLADESGLDKSDLLGIAIRLPEIWDSEVEQSDDNHWPEIEPIMIAAIDKFNEFREQEGAKLEKDLLERVAMIQKYLKEIESFEVERQDVVKEKLNKRLAEVTDVEGVDQNRLEQELVYYLEKMDITEEKVRLNAHCQYFEETAGIKDSVKGKKLGFISQEMGREINTIGSKANNLDIQRLVVQMKDELEKIKEQMLNVL